MEFFIFLILFLCVFLPSWNILCSATEYIRDRQEVVTKKMDSLDGIYQRTSKIVNRVDERLRISEYISYLKDLAIENPLTALVTLIVLGTIALPVLTFLFFAIATIAVTFIGFLFVNGTVITVAGVVFGSVICTFGAVALGVGAILAAIYYCVSHLTSFIQRFLPIAGLTISGADQNLDTVDEPKPVTEELNGFSQDTSQVVESNGHTMKCNGGGDTNGHIIKPEQNGWEKVG